MTTEYKIDAVTLLDCIRDIVAGEYRPHNPVLRYDGSSGRFSIESDLTPADDTKYQIGGQLNANEGLGCLFEGICSPEDVQAWYDSDPAGTVEWVRDMLVRPAVEESVAE